LTRSIPRPRIFGEGVAIVVCLLLTACSSSTPVGPPEWPFDPSGVWEGEAQGRLHGEDLTSLLVLNLLDDRSSCDACLRGTWEWGGLSGEVGVYWSYDGSPECDPEPGVYCPFGAGLDPPSPGACSEPPGIPGGGQALIHLRAQFESQTTLVAPELKGTFWEGTPSDGWPCPGPELLSFDAQMVLTLR
jgi:hypothetical protein